MGEFRMPSLGADMEHGTIVEWLVHPGDTIARGDVVAVVDTEKSTIDVEVFEDGVVERLLVEAGEEVPVGTPLAIIAGTGSPPAGPPAAPPAAPPVRPVATPRPTRRTEPRVDSPLVRHLADRLHVDTREVHGRGPGGLVTRADVEDAAARTTRTTRPTASPLARRRAAALGIDLRALTGSGPRGAIVARDLPTTTAPSRQERRRRAISDLVSRSAREIPHYHVSTTIELSRALDWLHARNAARPVAERVLPATLLLRATARAARDAPGFNGWWRDGRHVASAAVHLGVVVSLRDGGIVVPVISDAADLDIEALMARMRELVDRARTGGLRSSDMVEASITVTNLGERGADMVHGLIHPPQVALVGFGRIRPRPWAVDDQVVVRSTVTATLSGDHRVTDGVQGSALLATLDRLLQEPEDL